MIAGIFHEGSGLGDQLFRYITVRTLAEEKGFEWGMLQTKYFKGTSFLNLDMGHSPLEWPRLDMGAINIWNEKVVKEFFGAELIDIRSYDPEINFINDDTIIDGSFEDSKYWHHNLANINKWLAVEPLSIDEHSPILGFRGGEYYADPNLGLPKQYFDDAVSLLTSKYQVFHSFDVHTDDPELAKQWFQQPTFYVKDNERISHSKHTNMGYNWRSARYAKYAIIPNSAFFIIPRLLKHLEDHTAVTIAPRYWARHNTKTWARPACYYKEFTYI